MHLCEGIEMKSKESKWGPVKGFYVINFNAHLHNRTNDITNSKGPKFIWLSCEVSGAYTHEIVIDPPLPK